MYPSATMKADLHVHTRESSGAPQHWLGEFLGVRECYTQPEEALAVGQRLGMDAVAITNHDTAGDALRMAEARPRSAASSGQRRGPDNRVIPGCEYTVYAGKGGYVHVVVLGIDASRHERLMNERRRGLGRFTGLARSFGLPFFLAHPAWEVAREKSGIGPAVLCGWVEHFDILETVNGNCPAENTVAGGLARYCRKTAVGGSDSHAAASVGSAWTEADAGSVEEFMDRMRAGEVRPGAGEVRPGAGPQGFAAMVREVLGTFYRRELLKAARSGSVGGYFEESSASGLLRAAVELLLLPGFLWAPQAGTKAYSQDLARRAERLRRGLVDYLTQRLVRSLARDVLGAEERSRRWMGGVRAIYSAFGERRPEATEVTEGTERERHGQQGHTG